MSRVCSRGIKNLNLNLVLPVCMLEYMELARTHTRLMEVWCMYVAVQKRNLDNMEVEIISRLS
jgi:hypothetical protein